MTNQTPTPEQEQPGKVALDRISRAYVSELEGLVVQAESLLDFEEAHDLPPFIPQWAEDIATGAARADAAEMKIAILREALAPFVLALEQTNIGLGFDAAEKYASANMLQAHLTMKDFATARAALSLTTPDQEAQQ